MTSNLPLVLVVGATGHAGQTIVPALLASGKFRVAATTRPSSLSKPEVSELRSKGVEIRVANIPDSEKLNEVLAGVDVLISVVAAQAILDQKPLLASAKAAGVKRVVPCDFGTPGARGVRDLHDTKLVIRDYIKELGVGYTFIDVGWWMQTAAPSSTNTPSLLGAFSNELCGAGDKKMLLTDLEHIGLYVARIIVDERTLNQYVIIWEDEMTLREMHAISEEQSGEGEAMRAQRIVVTHQELPRRVKQAKDDYARSPSQAAYVMWAVSQYQISVHILGEYIIPIGFALFAEKHYKK